MKYLRSCVHHRYTFFRRGYHLLVLSALLVSSSAWATFPDRSIQLVAGSPPGGSTDFVARVLAEGMTEVLGQSVVVVNQGGAAGNIATRSLAKAKGDGYILMVGGNFSHGINPALYKETSYDPVKDFTAVARIANLPSVIAVNSATGIRTLGELIARARKSPGTINYASGGNGTPAHISAETFKRLAQINLTHIPFRGGAPAVVAVLSGEVEAIVGTPPVVMPQVANHKLTALAVTWPTRYSVLPDVPSSTEAGLPELAVQGWFGIWGPAGVPDDARQILFSAINQVLAMPKVQKRLAGEGLIVAPSASTQEFETFVKGEVSVWKQRVQESGATVN